MWIVNVSTVSMNISGATIQTRRRDWRRSRLGGMALGGVGVWGAGVLLGIIRSSNFLYWANGFYAAVWVDLQSSFEHSQHQQACRRSFAFRAIAVSRELEPVWQPGNHSNGGSVGAGRMCGGVGRMRECLSSGIGHDWRRRSGGTADEVCHGGVQPEPDVERAADDGRLFRRYGSGNGDAGGQSLLPGFERFGDHGLHAEQRQDDELI